MDFDTCICMGTAWFSFGSRPMSRTKPQTYVDIFPILVPMLYIKHELIYHSAAVQPSPLGWIWEQGPLLSWFSWLTWQKTSSFVAGFCWFHELSQLCVRSDECQSWSNGAGRRGDLCWGKRRSSGTSLCLALVSCLDWYCQDSISFLCWAFEMG